MEFQNILPFIILGIYILSLVGKRKKAGKESPAQGKSALKSIVQTIAKQWKEQVEAARRNGELQTGGQPESVQRSLLKAETVMEEGDDQEIEMDLPVEADFALDETERLVEEVLLDIPEEETGPKGTPPVGFCSASISVKKLREAVVWSEILGPPVALREGHRKLP